MQAAVGVDGRRLEGAGLQTTPRAAIGVIRGKVQTARQTSIPGSRAFQPAGSSPHRVTRGFRPKPPTPLRAWTLGPAGPTLLPMTIQERVDEDLKSAMRAKDADRLSVLRMTKAALMNAAIEKHGAGGKLADADALAVLRKQVKQRQDSIAGFEGGGRPELAEKERKEIAYLAEYLPTPLSEQEIQELVRAVVAETGATSKAQLGQVMKVLTERAAGRADGKTLSTAVQKQLP